LREKARAGMGYGVWWRNRLALGAGGMVRKTTWVWVGELAGSRVGELATLEGGAAGCSRFCRVRLNAMSRDDNPSVVQPATEVVPPVRASIALRSDPVGAARLFEQSVAIMARLRAPDGCPWDREQSFDSIRKYTLEEAYEVFDAIERRDWPHLSEELGDLLLQVLFYAEMAANEGHFTMAEVLEKLNSKLVRRHPHVFGEEASRAAGNRAHVDAAVEGSSAAVLRNWEEIKAAEALQKAAAPSAQKTQASSLDSVQRAMPALAEAAKLGSKAAKSGFDWPSWRDLLPKLVEETAELEAEAASEDPARKPAVEAELGDLLFTVVNLGRHLGVDAEMALRGCNRRFRERYRAMEVASDRPLVELAPQELEELWAAAKRELKASEALERFAPGATDRESDASAGEQVAVEPRASTPEKMR